LSASGTRITELFAWVVDDETGEHGIMGVAGPNGPMQAVSSKRRVLEMLRPIAEHVAKETGKPVLLLRFALAETVDVA
jgi:hypothetical protein